jgi:toxin ParE1/3/4
MPSYNLRPLAREDLIRQADFTSDSSLTAGRRFFSAVHKTCVRLAESPNSGEAIKRTRAEYEGLRIRRIRDFPNHIVFYRPIEDGVEVLRILHGAQDWQAMVGE